jgi:hypothetical protein
MRFLLVKNKIITNIPYSPNNGTNTHPNLDFFLAIPLNQFPKRFVTLEGGDILSAKNIMRQTIFANGHSKNKC